MFKSFEASNKRKRKPYLFQHISQLLAWNLKRINMSFHVFNLDLKRIEINKRIK